MVGVQALTSMTDRVGSGTDPVGAIYGSPHLTKNAYGRRHMQITAQGGVDPPAAVAVVGRGEVVPPGPRQARVQIVSLYMMECFKYA